MRDNSLPFMPMRPNRYGLRQNWVFILGLSLCFYFSYHLIQGERSYGRLIGLRAAITRSEADLKTMATEREDLTRRVEMLRPGSINRDYLEERARAMLGYRAPGDVDVVKPAPKSKS